VNLHLDDHELVMAMDGELRADDRDRVQTHLEACWTCRTRQKELEAAVADFVQLYKENGAASIPAANGPRALLKARMAEMGRQQRSAWWQPQPGWRTAWLGAMAAALLVAMLLTDRLLLERPDPTVVLAAPNPSLTPGAAVLEAPDRLCRESLPKNKTVPSALRRQVLAEYGVANASVAAYEVDYLITPALGGSDDIHNLWPHSYTNTEWNASVKDALEDRLHSMVCQGQLDLSTAQREIAANWIEAYKKYFHTDRPIARGEDWQRN